jgi:uncharacterized protein (TIGR03435 family)
MTKLLAVILGLCALSTVAAQDASFEAAALKRNVSADQGQLVDQQGLRYRMVNVTLRTMILNAYRPRSLRLIGAPGWVESERYDLEAIMPAGTSADQRAAMLRNLLAERARLVAHYEEREDDVYFLVLARADGRLGPSLRLAPRDCAAAAAAGQAGKPAPALPPAGNGAPPCGIRSQGGEFLAGGITMESLARNLGGSRSGRIVIDRTGLEGFYELTLNYDAGREATAATPGDVPTLFTALQEQLGLKLEAGRAPVQTVIIDRVERPTPD